MGAKHDIYFGIAVPAGYSIKMGSDGKKYEAYLPTDVGTVDHAALESNLEWIDSAHTGTAFSAPVFGAAGVATEVTPSALQSIRVNTGGNGWEAYTPLAVGSVVSDASYDESTWNAVTTVAPSKNAVRDKIESMVITPGSGNLGYLNIPQVDKSTFYATVLSDSGKCIRHPASDANSRVFYIPSYTVVDYPEGTVIMFTNKSANDITIGSLETLTLDGTGDDGFFTLGQYGKATAMKEVDGEWSISGTNLTVVTPIAFTKDSELLSELAVIGGTGTGTVTFSDPVVYSTVAFYDVNTNALANGTATITAGYGTDTLTISFTAPTDFEDVYLKGNALSDTGYVLVGWQSDPYTLF